MILYICLRGYISKSSSLVSHPPKSSKTVVALLRQGQNAVPLFHTPIFQWSELLSQTAKKGFRQTALSGAIYRNPFISSLSRCSYSFDPWHQYYALDMARYDRLNVFAIFLFMGTNPQPFPCLSRLRKHIYCVFGTIGRREHIHSW